MQILAASENGTVVKSTHLTNSPMPLAKILWVTECHAANKHDNAETCALEDLDDWKT